MASSISSRDYETLQLIRSSLDQMSKRLEAGESFSQDQVNGVVDSIQVFAERYRHPSEDDFYFRPFVPLGLSGAMEGVLDAGVDLEAYRSLSSALPVDWRKHVTIVMAMLNEEEGLADLLAECRRYADELIAVDGHSTDRTASIAAKAGARVLYDNGKGKGDAIRAAIPHIGRDIAVFMDADWSHDPADIPKLVQPILANGADHVTGSRLLGGSSELHGGFDEFLRLTGSSLITAFIGWRFHQRLSDSQNGFRAIRTEVLRKLGLQEDITTIEQEMIIKTLKQGYRLAEVPTHEYKRRYKESHIVLRRVWLKYVSSMLRYLFS